MNFVICVAPCGHQYSSHYATIPKIYGYISGVYSVRYQTTPFIFCNYVVSLFAQKTESQNIVFLIS